MDRYTKFLLIFGGCTMSLVFAATTPMIEVYFINLIGPQTLAAANIISVGLAAAVNATVPNDKAKEFYRRHFKAIVLLDVAGFCLVSFAGYEQPELRFLGFAVVNSITTTLWGIVIGNAVNRKIQGDELTDWNFFEKAFYLAASLLGGVFALFVTELSIETCLFAQCAANIIFGITDLQAFKRLNRKDTDDETRKEGELACQ